MAYQTYFVYDMPPVPRDDDFALTVQYLTGSTNPALATPVDFTGYQGGLFYVWGNRGDPAPLAVGTVALQANGQVALTLARGDVALLAPGTRYYSVVLVSPDGTHHTLMRGTFPVV